MAVLASAVWRVRPSGNNLNGGGYDPGIGGAATDYSQQNAAQATGTNGATTGAGVTTFTDATAAAFTSAMVGNCIQIASGTNFQAGWYFVVSFTNANSVVLDRTPTSGGAGSAGVWKLGGGWASPFTNTLSTGPLVPGNNVYILGSGTPNPASYTYDYTYAGTGTPITLAQGTTSGSINFLNDPATPGYKAPPDTTGGMPVIKIDGQITNTSQYNRWAGLWFVLSNNLNTNGFLIQAYNLAFAWIGNVIDFFGFGSISGLQLAAGGALVAGSEFFSSVNAGALDETKGTIVIAGGAGSAVIGCNIHDIPGISAISCAGTGALITGCILAKCGGDGVNFRAGSGNGVINCTIDGNGINGIKVATSGDFGAVSILNNIISNHTAGGAFGLTIGTGTPAINNTFGLCDYNTYYNNTANYNAVSAGPHDTALGVTPYVGQATENYTLV